MFEVLLLEISRGGTRQDCVPLPAGARSGRRSPGLRGWDNRQCSRQTSSFQAGRPSCEGLGLTVEVAVCGVCGACLWCVGVGGAPLPPLPLFPLPLPHLPAALEETGALRGRRGGGSWEGGEKEAGAKGPAPGETEGVRKEMPLHTSTRVCTAHVPNTELARWQLPGTREPALSQALGDLACGPASA